MRENWLSSQLHLLIVLPPMSELYTEYILPEPMILHQNIVPNNIINTWKNISTEAGGQYIQTGNKSMFLYYESRYAVHVFINNAKTFILIYI